MADNGKMKIVYRNISELVPAEYNPRLITKHDFTQLKKSLEKFDAVEPAIINTYNGRENVIIGGHQRLKAAVELCHKTFPCYEVELNPEQERELNIRLNKNVGTWDMDILANNFDTDELHEFGFTDLDLGMDSGGSAGLTDEDAVPESPKESKTKPGDLYILGDHRLLCGDSTNVKDVERLMDGEKADICISSPPYWNQREYSHWDDFDGYMADMIKVWGAIKTISLRSGGILFWNIGDDSANHRHISAYHSTSIDSLGFVYIDSIIWKKPGVTGIRLSHQKTHKKYYPGFCFEPLLVFQNGKGNFPSFDENTDVPLTNVWEINCETRLSDNHSAPFPVRLPETAIKCYTKTGHGIYEPFAGSGSTLIACEKTDRKCYGMEIDTIYCDVIVKRWEEFTGKTAELCHM